METTREKARRMSQEETIDALNKLLEKNYDAENGYRTAIKDADDSRLKNYFVGQAAARSQNATELDKAIRDLNGQPAEKGSTTAAAHRMWMDIKTAFTGNDDEAILEECIRGDEAAVADYEEVLEKSDYLGGAQPVLEYQLSGIKNTLNNIKTMEDVI
ncbi:ferritin-like domain-containing protein [Nonlabens xiamenensis]|uniref:ferritin-like domain-containing protein n=1 Tax=Nonlabens xiamenensis TaxID=2341043 RepID=UPI000F604B4B|nr:PA2169 family four-helix-bundle protein [Nonlabens xiamenensis]